MAAQELFTVSLEPNPLECWADESTASALRALAVRLHSTVIWLRETAAVLEEFGVTRSHQAVWQWVHRTAETAPDPPTTEPSRVSVDETAVTIGTEQHGCTPRLTSRRSCCSVRSFLSDVERIQLPRFSSTGWDI